jgi:riboflavin kinase/FMN adenylyltransferase
MRVFRSLERARGQFSRPVVTIGNFDGVHRGHAVILDQVREDADHRGVSGVALTFEPHPISLLRPEAAPRLLMPLGDRVAGLERAGMDGVVIQRFDRAFAAIDGDDFIRRFLVEILDVQKLIVGHDLNFGRGRSGNVETLVEAGGRLGFSVEVIQPVSVDGIVVHSTVVREAVAAGDMALATKLLGKPHMVRGRVVHGAGRGRKIGFATANVRAKTHLIPPDGVYVTRAQIDGRSLEGVTSIGHTPTFGGEETVIETHLFVEWEDFYAKSIRVQFLDRIRDQRKFSGPEELGAQIANDVEYAKAVFAASASEQTD